MISAMQAIEDALAEHDSTYEKKIAVLESEVSHLKKERELIRKTLAEGNIELLKTYLMID